MWPSPQPICQTSESICSSLVVRAQSWAEQRQDRTMCVFFSAEKESCVQEGQMPERGRETGKGTDKLKYPKHTCRKRHAIFW